jgi:uncharacterized protein YjaG (DUF416 family)
MSDDFGGNYRDWCRTQLGNLSPRHWAAFAASCAERQFGTYTYVSKVEPGLKPQVLRDAIDRGWAHAGGKSQGHADLERLKELTDVLIPDLDESTSAYASLILDAAGAASSLLAVCLNSRVDDAVEAGECARNAVDEWVLTTIDANPDGRLAPITVTPDERNRVRSHPLMLREMQQQQTDIAYLREHAVLGPQECLRLRRSWPNGVKSNLDLE